MMVLLAMVAGGILAAVFLGFILGVHASEALRRLEIQREYALYRTPLPWWARLMRKI